MENFRDFLQALCANQGLTTHAAKIVYLSGLKDVARDLKFSYQDDEINVNYSDTDIQMVYMTRYFPFYTQVVKHELDILREKGVGLLSLNNDPLHLSLFCCGPAPEAYGIMRFLRESGIRPQVINVNVFDIYANAWQSSRNVAINHIRTHVLPRTIINVNPFTYNLRLPINATQLVTVAPSNLVVFQNCLNEIDDAGRIIVEASLIQIIAALNQGSIIAIFERSGYNPILNYLNQLTILFKANGCEILTPAISNAKLIKNTTLRSVILNTECSSLYKIWEQPMTGLVISPDVTYWSLIVRKL